MVTTKWVVENDIGHWVVSRNGYSISCDENELHETIRELEEMTE